MNTKQQLRLVKFGECYLVLQYLKILYTHYQRLYLKIRLIKF